MATSKCAACGSTGFELVEATITGIANPHFFVQCVKCGAVVGVMPRKDIATQLVDLQRDIDKLKRAANIT